MFGKEKFYCSNAVNCLVYQKYWEYINKTSNNIVTINATNCILKDKEGKYDCKIHSKFKSILSSDMSKVLGVEFSSDDDFGQCDKILALNKLENISQQLNELAKGGKIIFEGDKK